MVYKGIDPNEPRAFILPKDDEDNPTVWWLKPQTVAAGNKHLVGYKDAFTKKTQDSIAKKTTSQDLVQFMDTIDHVDNILLRGESEPKDVTDPDELKRLFYQIDINTFNVLMNASRDIFELTEAEKNGSSSSSGQPSGEKRAEGSGTTAEPARSSQEGQDGSA